MEITINRDCFYEAISEVSKSVSSKALLPILTGIKIIATADGLTLIGSNSDMVIKKVIPMTNHGKKVLEVHQTGNIVISAKYLDAVVKKLPNDVHLKAKGNKVAIQSSEIMTSLNGFDPEEYPNLPLMDHSTGVEIPSVELIEVIKQTVFAASKNSTRPVLTGVYFSFHGGQLTLVATNSHRLALRKLKVTTNINSSCIVPSPALVELTKLFKGDTIEVAISDSYIVFHSNTTTVFKNN